MTRIHTPDPTFTAADRTRANFRLAAKVSLGFVGLLWLLQLVGWGLGDASEVLGIRPRRIDGLPGILFAPLLHGGFGHLLANSAPLLVLGTVMLHVYPRSARTVLPAVYLGPGVAVWLTAASGSSLATAMNKGGASAGTVCPFVAPP